MLCLLFAVSLQENKPDTSTSEVEEPVEYLDPPEDEDQDEKPGGVSFISRSTEAQNGKTSETISGEGTTGTPEETATEAATGSDMTVGTKTEAATEQPAERTATVETEPEKTTEVKTEKITDAKTNPPTHATGGLDYPFVKTYDDLHGTKNSSACSSSVLTVATLVVLVILMFCHGSSTL
ncbi:unnamed protein product [Heligmosomoides polygyrus]|uniref:Trans-sialidase n=1 Tax=Heligmosomoides polygyrus TaxID=6339 RepID=A0A183FTA8_HELPZ|nr:unnamed protein product [Heligmosomoides polygyrus]